MSEIAHDPADETAMRLALDQARNAWLIGEVPVGAVVMRGAQVIATGYNRATSAACLERSLSMTRSTHRDSCCQGQRMTLPPATPEPPPADAGPGEALH